MTGREPLTTGNGHVDLSMSRPGTSAAAARSAREAALFTGYRHPAPVEDSRPCACGGEIRATFGDWGSVFAAISFHQELTIHRMWREANDL